MCHFTLKVLALITALCCVFADDIDLRMKRGAMIKVIRQIVNQTKADALRLPANATSIREKISDTFSCANRTYGYYADVDNDCQIFHVCLPTTGKRNGKRRSYRWSFICPKETIFNQEVLVCTRQRDSIDCQDSPFFYDVNLEFGKIQNNTNKNDKVDSDKSLTNINKSKDEFSEGYNDKGFNVNMTETDQYISKVSLKNVENKFDSYRKSRTLKQYKYKKTLRKQNYVKPMNIRK